MPGLPLLLLQTPARRGTEKDGSSMAQPIPTETKVKRLGISVVAHVKFHCKK